MCNITLSSGYREAAKHARVPAGWRIATPSDYRVGVPILASVDGGITWDQDVFSIADGGGVYGCTWYLLRAVRGIAAPGRELHEDEGG